MNAYAGEVLRMPEIVRRISQHLRRIAEEGTVADICKPMAWVAGPRIGVQYVSFQPRVSLSKVEALKYLKWLDAGNAGRYCDILQSA